MVIFRILLGTCLLTFSAASSRAADASTDAYGKLAPIAPATPSGPLAFRLIARQEAERANVPYDLVDAVMKVESGYQPGQIGGVGEIGLMQVRPGTAAMLGFRGPTADLADPATNIHYGTTYLGQAWHMTKGNVCRTLMKYRAGHGEDIMSTLSSTYCARARDHLLAMKSPLAATITPADLVAAVISAPASAATANAPRARSGRAFWVAFQARIKTINARIEAKWRRTAAR